MNDFPLISVIILNWNGREYLCSCVDSVKEQTYPNIEIILVDNASTDHSLEALPPISNPLRIIVNPRNLGYGGGNNRGIQEARGRYIFVVNSDTEIKPDCVAHLWKGIEADPCTGVTTPKILLYHQRDRIDAAGLSVYPDGLSIGRGRLEPHERYDRMEEVFFGSGCASLFRKEMLEQIGLFDEDFFAYAEDTDLGWRARLAGWKAFFVPEAVVYHHHSKALGAYSPRKAFLVERNRIWVAWKNFPLSLLCLWPFYTALRYFYQGIGVLTRKGASGRFAREFSPSLLIFIAGKASWEALKGLPNVLKKRKVIQKKKKISNGAIYVLLKKYGIKARKIAYLE